MTRRGGRHGSLARKRSASAFNGPSDACRMSATPGDTSAPQPSESICGINARGLTRSSGLLPSARAS